MASYHTHIAFLRRATELAHQEAIRTNVSVFLLNLKMISVQVKVAYVKELLRRYLRVDGRRSGSTDYIRCNHADCKTFPIKILKLIICEVFRIVY